MKRLFIMILFATILLCGCSKDQSFIHNPTDPNENGQSLTDDPVTPDTFVFDKNTYPVITDAFTVDARYVPDINTAEKVMMENLNGSEMGVIAECTIVGESINWIAEPPLAEQESGVEYGSNHVLTPVRIDRILYAGTSVNVDVGTEFLLIEPYFYVTDQTPDYQKMYHTTEVIAAVSDYNPVVKDNRYLMFLRLADFYAESEFAYSAEEGTMFFVPVSRQFAIYGIGSKETVAKELVTVQPDFWSSWEQVMEVYVNSKSDTPFTKPQIYTDELSK